MGRIQTVFLDLDDTLFDRNRAQSEILRGIVRELHPLVAGVRQGNIAEAFAESDRAALQEYEAGNSAQGGIETDGC